MPPNDGPPAAATPAATAIPAVALPPAPPPLPLAVAAAQHLAVSVPGLSQSPVMSLWASFRPGKPTGALFGIAGLFLAPIAGVWLGYRQARAAKSAAQPSER